MSTIGVYTPEEFKHNFDLDFGSGVRGAYVSDLFGTCGLALVHYLEQSEVVCGVSIFWRYPTADNTKRSPSKYPLWAVEKEGPGELLTLKPDITCSCGLHGSVTHGVWTSA